MGEVRQVLVAVTLEVRLSISFRQNYRSHTTKDTRSLHPEVEKYQSIDIPNPAGRDFTFPDRFLQQAILAYTLLPYLLYFSKSGI